MSLAGLFVHDASGGVSAPVVIAVVVVLAGAWLYHNIADHHWHLALLRVVRPSVVVPPADHDSKWHSLSHPKQLAVNAMLTGVAILIGLAWELSPYVVASLVLLAAVAWIIWKMTRTMTVPGRSRVTTGSRSRPGKTEGSGGT